MYEIIVEPPAEKFIKTLKKDEQKKILDRIDGLSRNPRQGKELVGKLSGLRSLRYAVYRAIYKIEEMKMIVLVLRVGHRRNVYSKKIAR
jgi:mRNA interferase RelE/StbE